MRRSWGYLGSAVAVFLAGAALGMGVQRILAGRGTPPSPFAVGVPHELRGQLSLFVLAGQSNMSGWAPLPAVPEVHPRAFLFGNDYRWRVASEPSDHGEGQVDAVSLDRGRELGTSPGLTFATTLLGHRPELVVGLIPCAKGNSTILEWQRHAGDDTLYGSCLKRIAAASTMGRLSGVLFFQGETDALDPARAPGRPLAARDYRERFIQLVGDLRRDLSRPTLPVVFAQIGSHRAPEAYRYWAVVQAQQASIRLPCVAMITTSDLPLRDNVHYTTESYQTIGRRFAEAYLELTRAQTCD